MSDYDRWTQSVRASRQLYRLALGPELWRCHDVMDHADRVTRGLPPRWGNVPWRHGGMVAKVAGLSARIEATWRNLSRRATRAVPVLTGQPQ
jgi:hypothetical protein